jgi:hypothetical protein
MNSTNEKWSVEPTGYDVEGLPLYECDELDKRYDAFIDSLKGGNGWTDVDMAFTYLAGDAAESLTTALALLREMGERQQVRRKCALDPVEGYLAWRASVLDPPR